MGGDRRGATSTFAARISEAVGDELRAAAIARWDASPDVFVWRARRCAEAVLYSALNRERVDVEALAKQRKGLDQLLEHKQIGGALSRETHAQLSSLRDFGNIAAHYQLTGGVSRESADGVAHLLTKMLREFYAFDGGSVPEALRGPLAALTDRGARTPTPAEVEVERLRREAAALQGMLATARAAPRSQRPSAGRALAIGGSLALAVGAFGFALGRGSAEDCVSTDTRAAQPAPTLVLSPDVPPALPSPSMIPIPPAPAEPDEPVMPSPAVPPPVPPSRTLPSCPAAMTPVRPASDVAPFCIDADAVLERDYRQCVVAGACDRPEHQPGEAGCNWDNRADHLPANCIRWSLARAYCRSTHGSTSDLPTRSEWEAAAAVRPVLRLVVPGTDEWSFDAAMPDTPLIRMRRVANGFTWEPATEGQTPRHVTFRCVVHATP